MDARPIPTLNTHTFSAPSLASEAISVLSLSPMSGALSWWKPYDRNLARHLRDQMSAGLDRFRAEAQRYWQCTKRHRQGYLVGTGTRTLAGRNARIFREQSHACHAAAVERHGVAHLRNL